MDILNTQKYATGYNLEQVRSLNKSQKWYEKVKFQRCLLCEGKTEFAYHAVCHILAHLRVSHDYDRMVDKCYRIVRNKVKRTFTLEIDQSIYDFQYFRDIPVNKLSAYTPAEYLKPTEEVVHSVALSNQRVARLFQSVQSNDLNTLLDIFA